MAHRRSEGSNTWTTDESRNDPQHAPCGSVSPMDFPSDDSTPSFLSDVRGQPDLRDLAPLATDHRTSILARICALAVSVIAIVAAAINSNVPSGLIDKPSVSMGGAASDQSATHAAGANASALQSDAPSSEAITSVEHAALQSQIQAAPTGNDAAAPPKTLDAATLAALTTRAKNLLALGDIAAARLLLERAANAKDATAAFLLAQTYDPAVLGARDTRSIAPDLVMACNWYGKAASFGSSDAQQRLAQFQK
jgi:hypothetical protein